MKSARLALRLSVLLILDFGCTSSLQLKLFDMTDATTAALYPGITLHGKGSANSCAALNATGNHCRAMDCV